MELDTEVEVPLSWMKMMTEKEIYMNSAVESDISFGRISYPER